VKAASIGWTAQSEIAHKLANYRPTLPELYTGQNEGTARQIADVCAALKHPETDAAILLVGPRSEIRAALDLIGPQFGWQRVELAENQGKAGQP
jgi:hypothetical protein